MQKLVTYPRAVPSAVPLVKVQSIQNEPEQDPAEAHSRITIIMKITDCFEKYKKMKKSLK